MARQRIVLEEDASFTGAASQDSKFSVKVGGAKSGFAVFVLSASVTGSTLMIETTPFSNPGASTNSGLWASAGSGSSLASGPGLVTVALTNMMDVLRWRVTGTGALRFSVVLYLYDT